MGDELERDAMHELAEDERPPAPEEALEEFEVDEGEGFEEELDEFDALEEGEEGAFAALEEEGEWGDPFADDGASLDALEDALADALDAADSDEFFRRLLGSMSQVAGGARRVAGGVAGVAGQVQREGRRARGLAQRVQRISGRAARARSPAGYLMQQLGQYLNQGFDELDALEDLADLYAEEGLDEFVPAIAGLVARTAARPLLRRAAGTLGRTAGRQLVRSAGRAVRTLVSRHGPQAARALPRIAQSVARRAARGRLPPSAVARTLQRASQRVAGRPGVVRRLAGAAAPAWSLRPPPGGGWPRRLVLRGPVEITITSR